MVPVAPGKNSTGRNTHIFTSEVAITAENSSSMVAFAASTAVRPVSFLVEVSSITVMASSTTKPVASTKPNKVSWFSENPNPSTKANVPTKATGMAMPGTNVAFQFCRNRNRISTTRTTASRREPTTPWMDALMKSVESKTCSIFMPTGMVCLNSSITCFTPSDTTRALLPLSWLMVILTVGLPSRLTAETSYISPPS